MYRTRAPSKHSLDSPRIELSYSAQASLLASHAVPSCISEPDGLWAFLVILNPSETKFVHAIVQMLQSCASHGLS